ncbi:hypothetical protein, partial [Moorena sp. SIO2C4]|uniref:hypothetical protein n=1 Tax=Moorena sp. SIO2C4 TaxID=2607824 RepID=UPI0013C68D8E
MAKGHATRTTLKPSLAKGHAIAFNLGQRPRDRVQHSTQAWPKATRSRSTLAKGHAIAFNIQPKLGQRPRDRVQPWPKAT